MCKAIKVKVIYDPDVYAVDDDAPPPAPSTSTGRSGKLKNRKSAKTSTTAAAAKLKVSLKPKQPDCIFTCHSCGKQFSVQANYIAHLRVHVPKAGDRKSFL